jgi:hypothetical protein
MSPPVSLPPVNLLTPTQIVERLEARREWRLEARRENARTAEILR